MVEHSKLNDASFLRQRALQLRFLADQSRDDHSARLLYDAATDYEAGAEMIEATEATTFAPTLAAAE